MNIFKNCIDGAIKTEWAEMTKKLSITNAKVRPSEKKFVKAVRSIKYEGKKENWHKNENFKQQKKLLRMIFDFFNVFS